MTRFLSLCLANLKCQAYLLFLGMWRGESMLKGWHEDGRVALIATTKGNIRNGKMWCRVFWNETPAKFP